MRIIKVDNVKIGLYNLEPHIVNTAMMQVSQYYKDQGDEVEICLYFEYGEQFTKGVYSVEAYTTEGKLGSADVLLR